MKPTFLLIGSCKFHTIAKSLSFLGNVDYPAGSSRGWAVEKPFSRLPLGRVEIWAMLSIKHC